MLGHDLLEGVGPLDALAAQLVDARLGHPLQRGVEGGEHAGQRDEADRDDQQGDPFAAHLRGLVTAAAPATRVRR